MDHDYLYVDTDACGEERVILKRFSHERLLVSRPMRHGEVVYGLGLDTRAYMAAGDFTHEFIPYARHPEGCDVCGWNRRIHSLPRTHIECDWCGSPEDIWMSNRVKMYEKSEPTQMSLGDGRTVEFDLPVCLTRFFCPSDCLEAWLGRFAPEG